MKKAATLTIAAALIASVSLAGCVPASNAQLGSTTGAVLGGVLGNQVGKGNGKVAATIAGTIIGSAIGGQIGAQWDAYDQQNVNNAVYTGQPKAWQNPNNGYSYTATPGNVYQSTYQGYNTECRPVTVAARLPNGQYQNIQMNACRDGSGVWRQVS
ncbi:MAG: glycine zipper 2TM domain-containing protein [Thiothrix sp.]|nr:glycine zipper 2TM domain-containing protein [Thiothrix sp.]